MLVDYIYDMGKVKSFRQYFKNWRGWTIENILPNDPENILLSGEDIDGYSSLAKVNVYTGEKLDIASGRKHKIHQWYADHEGEVRIGVRLKKEKVRIFSVVGSDETKLQLTPMKAGEHNLDFDGASFADQRVFFNAFSYDGDSVYLTENSNRNTFRIVEHSLKENRTIRVLAESNKFDIGYPGRNYDNLTGYIFDHHKKTLAGIRYSTFEPITLWFDEDLIKLQKKMNKAAPNTVNLILDWTVNRDRFVIHSFSDKVAGKTSIYIKSQNRLAVVSDNADIYKQHKLGDTEFTYYTARDGSEIPAYVTYGRGKDNTLPPLVVIPHGGPWANDSYGYDPEVQFFATRGYTVLQPQFRGSTGFGRKHMLDAKYDLMGIMIDDIADGVNWLIDTKKADPKRIYTYGTSYGGYASIMGTVKYPKLYKAGVSMASPTNLLEQIKYYKKEDFAFAYDYWKALAGDPSTGKKSLLAASPITHIKKMNTPLLVAAGEDDSTVPIKQFNKFEAAVKKSKAKHIKTQMFKNEGHGFENPSNHIYFVEQALRLFENN